MLDLLKNKQQYHWSFMVYHYLYVHVYACIIVRHNNHVQSHKSLIASNLRIPNPKQFAYLHI